MFKIKENLKTTKGMLFAGCSFTWGQGLNYYSNMPSLMEQLPNQFDPTILKHSHYEYIKANRFPRLVANYFNVFEICQPFNGGATHSNIKYWTDWFDDTDQNKGYTGPLKYEYKDFSHMFYQFTQWTRTKLTESSKSHFETMCDESFPDFLKNNNLSIDDYINDCINFDINWTKSFLKKFEDKGIKIYVMSWPSDLIPFIIKDEWFRKRLITFNYKNIEYTNLEDMIGNQYVKVWNGKHPELVIAKDTLNFEIPPNDYHPSKLCHQVIAKNIIERLEQDQE